MRKALTTTRFLLALLPYLLCALLLEIPHQHGQHADTHATRLAPSSAGLAVVQLDCADDADERCAICQAHTTFASCAVPVSALGAPLTPLRSGIATPHDICAPLLHGFASPRAPPVVHS